MGFSFGNLAVDTKPKSLTVASKDKVENFILENHYNPSEDYYLFLIEGMPKNKSILKKVVAEIDKAGYQSYLLATVTNCTFDKDKIKIIKEHMKSFKTGWASLLSYNDESPKAIMTFGSALTSVNGYDADLTVDCFYDMWMNKPYYYLGHGFIGNYDTFVFPVDGLEALYPTFEDSDTEPTNWKTRFFKKQLINMKGNKELPDDMSDFTITVSKEA